MKSAKQWDEEGRCYAGTANAIQDDALLFAERVAGKVDTGKHWQVARAIQKIRHELWPSFLSSARKVPKQKWEKEVEQIIEQLKAGSEP